MSSQNNLNESVHEARAELRRWLEERLGSESSSPAIARFDEALTHPSFSNESGDPDNQRLEFLGDAVLGLCVSEILSSLYPAADEGKLTRMRAALVNSEALAAWARTENIGAALALGRGARAGTERDQTNVLADAVEALVAAVYESRGIAGARLLVKEIIQQGLLDVRALEGRDPKSELQEQVQARGLPTPTYRVIETRGPQHDPNFEVAALVGDETIGKGEGKSKRAAERAAALDALTKMNQRAEEDAAEEAAEGAPEGLEGAAEVAALGKGE